MPANGAITIDGYTGPGGDLLIPDKINGLPVVSIGNSAFAGSGLTSVVVPSSVNSIGYLTFDHCSGLTNACFAGNAPTTEDPPSFDMTEFRRDNQVTVYYLPGTMGWESTFGGTPNRYGPSFGTVPTAPWLLPEPRILNNNTNFGVQNGQFGFTISWATNASVVVEACANLDTSAWKSIQTNTLDGGTSYFSDPEWAKYSHRFYRLSLP